ncbi:MAG: M1 family metallopeptidase [Bacteroidota bacterium]
MRKTWRKNIYSCLIVWMAGASVYAQTTDLYVPLEIQRAYQRGTRTITGKPGPNYWQNRSDYTISAELNPATRTLRGQETVVYTNNSPDTLRQLVIRLYPDIFKKGNARDKAVNPDDINNGVNISQLSINGTSIDLEKASNKLVAANTHRVSRAGTNLSISLNSTIQGIPSPMNASILPKGTLRLQVTWDYVIPKETHIREGAYGENTFFVAYWYPQIAVYDDIDDWDTMDYTGTQEFYNDFSNFNVEVKVPNGFLVWATGVWQNAKEVLTPNYLNRYQTATQSAEVVHVVTEEDLKKGGITVNKPQNSWRYQATDVPDFAFATSNRYLWDATSAITNAEKGSRTTVGAVYDPTTKDFYEVARYGQKSIEFLSTQMPGIPFPYPNLTVFNGSGGMEFPMMVNDGSFPSPEQAAEVTAHEIAHTYFPFYMGINERKYAWMDEGWAQFLPNEATFTTTASTTDTFTVQNMNAPYLAYFAGKEMEMPMMIPSNLLHGGAYAFATYFRPAMAYATLQELLGKEKFKTVLQEYMHRWHGKHPIPYDFFFSFNDVAKEDLSWFWKPWFFESGYPDLAIKEVSAGKQTNITILRKGRLPVPIRLKITFADGTQELLSETARVWSAGAKEFVFTKKFGKTIQQIKLGDATVADVNLKDNVYEEKK